MSVGLWVKRVRVCACKRSADCVVYADGVEDIEPVDKETVAKVKALEQQLHEKEAAVKELRERVRTCGWWSTHRHRLKNHCTQASRTHNHHYRVQVPKLAAEKTRRQLEKSRKRSADMDDTCVAADCV